jgi:hypothetical protein
MEDCQCLYPAAAKDPGSNSLSNAWGQRPSRGAPQVAATLSYDANTNTVTLTPSVTLDAFMVYSVLVKGGSNGVKDPYGNTMSADYTMSFTTGG